MIATGCTLSCLRKSSEDKYFLIRLKAPTSCVVSEKSKYTTNIINKPHCEQTSKQSKKQKPGGTSS